MKVLVWRDREPEKKNIIQDRASNAFVNVIRGHKRMFAAALTAVLLICAGTIAVTVSDNVQAGALNEDAAEVSETEIAVETYLAEEQSGTEEAVSSETVLNEPADDASPAGDEAGMCPAETYADLDMGDVLYAADGEPVDDIRSPRLLSDGEEDDWYEDRESGDNTDNDSGKVSESRTDDSKSTVTADTNTPVPEIKSNNETGKEEDLTASTNEAMMLDLTPEEITILEKIVEAEATDEDVYGRMLVANVVINRVNSRYFPNDVKSVVFQKISGSIQFSPVEDGRYYSVPVTEETKEAVRRVLAGEDYSEGALYFFERARTTSKKASWFEKNLKYLMKYGCHEFYTEYAR